jgi:hypothetical protein
MNNFKRADRRIEDDIAERRMYRGDIEDGKVRVSAAREGVRRSYDG